MSTPKDIFETRIAAKTRQPDLQKRINAVYRFDLSGPLGGSWIVDFKPATAGVRQTDEPGECAAAMSDQDFLSLIDGKLDPAMAFMSGKIKVTGDMMLAMKLGKMF
jgi:predicted lipid carrier protein YhbT